MNTAQTNALLNQCAYEVVKEKVIEDKARDCNLKKFNL